MEKIILKAEARTETGKIASKHLRKENQIPGVVYKGGKNAVSIHVNDKDLWHALHTDAGENAVITLDIAADGKHSNKTVIVQEIQTDPINDKFIHVDFHEISLTEKLKVNVPVVVKGEAPGVTEDEGVLSQIEWELEVECLPTAIPENIEVHVNELRINDAVHIKDLEQIEGVSFTGDPEQVLVVVNPPQAEEEEEEAEEVLEGEEGAEPEVIKKGKKEEEGEEGAGEEGASEKPAAKEAGEEG